MRELTADLLSMFGCMFWCHGSIATRASWFNALKCLFRRNETVEFGWPTIEIFQRIALPTACEWSIVLSYVYSAFVATRAGHRIACCGWHGVTLLLAYKC